MKYLSLWEFGRKQDYIFKSNKLIEAVGASLIIKKLTEDFKDYSLDDKKFILKKGGKALYLFDTIDEAKEFNKKFSINLIKEYPGLDVFMVIHEFDEENDDIRNKIEEIYMLLEKKKAEKKHSAGQISFGIERICRSTGLPASGSYTEKNIKTYYSSESMKKREIGGADAENAFESLLPEGYKYDKIADNLVEDERKTYISVVHIDGNGMGLKFKTLKNKIKRKNGESQSQFNKRYVDLLKKFSETVNEAYEEAFKYTMNVIEKNKDKLKDVTKIMDKYFPVRPLILAGDDITYMANGYIGIESAKVFIENLSKKTINIEGIDLGNLSACAGVAIVKKGYPFIKAYELAEDLCKNAKKRLIEKNNKELTAIDFHIAQGEINGDISYIRRKDYSLNSKEGILTMRPLIIGDHKEWRNYDNFIEAFDRIQRALKQKAIGRSKIKALREQLRKGKEATEHFIKFYSIEAGKYFPPVAGKGDYCFNTAEDDRCMYLDAIEVMDMFIKLDE